MTLPADNMLHHKETLSAHDAADFEGISVQAMRKRCKKSGFQKKPGPDGMEYQIPCSKLPMILSPAAQRRHAESLLSPQVRQENEAAAADRIADADADAIAYSAAPTWARGLFDKYRFFLTGPGKDFSHTLLREFLPTYKAENPDLKISISGIYKARRDYKSKGMAGVLAHWGKRAGGSIVKNADFEYFRRLFLTQDRRSVFYCRTATLGRAQKTEPTITTQNFPSPISFRKRLFREIPESAIYYARYGEAKWNRKFGAFIDRDYSNICAGQIYVSDHHQLDAAAMLRDGRIVYPWVTVFRDFLTGKWLGWKLRPESPNSDAIFSALHDALFDWGLCKEVLIDNGRDYRSKDFAGGRPRPFKILTDEKSPQVTALFSLGIIPHFALPYNAQSKPIERDFLKVNEWFSKSLPGYRGHNAADKPEKLSKETKRGDIIPFEEYERCFNDFIKNILNKMPSRGKVLLGRSPDAAWAELFTVKRCISKEALRLFLSRTTDIRTIGRNGVKDDMGLLFWSDWMSGQKSRKVYLRQDRKDWGNAFVFDAANHEFLGMAQSGLLTAPGMASTPVEKSEVVFAIRRKNQDRKITKAYVKQGFSIDPLEALGDLKRGVSAIAGETAEPNPKIYELPDTVMDSVIRKRDKMEREGTGIDIAAMMSTRQPRRHYAMFEDELEDPCPYPKPPIFQWDDERQAWEAEHGPLDEYIDKRDKWFFDNNPANFEQGRAVV